MVPARTMYQPIVLGEKMIQSLAPISLRKRWMTGEFVARFGQRMDSVSVCLSGQYKISLNSIDGHTWLLRNISVGEMFGIPSALTGVPFPTDAVCEVPGETFEISRHELLALLRREPDLALIVIKSLAARVSEMFGLMEEDLLPTLRTRVYHRLLRLAHFNGTFDRNGHINLPLTQNEIAQSLRASRPKVHQELKRLEKEGIVRLNYGSITLLQIEPPTSSQPI